MFFIICQHQSLSPLASIVTHISSSCTTWGVNHQVFIATRYSGLVAYVFVKHLLHVLEKCCENKGIITTNVFPMISDLEGSHTHIHTLSLTLFSLPPNCVSVAVDQTSFVLRDRTTGYSVCESLSSRPAASGEFSLFTERKNLCLFSSALCSEPDIKGHGFPGVSAAVLICQQSSGMAASYLILVQ